MGQNYTDAEVKCPFFVCQEKREITCQFVVESMRTKLTFKRIDQKEKWLEGYCNGIDACAECPVHKMLWERM